MSEGPFSSRYAGQLFLFTFQMACRKLLSEIQMLAFPPWSVRQELSEAVEHCAHPSKYYNTPNLNKAGPDIADRLEAILKRSIEE